MLIPAKSIAMAPDIPINRAVPRSGCLIIKITGIKAINIATNIYLTLVFNCLSEQYEANINVINIFRPQIFEFFINTIKQDLFLELLILFENNYFKN